MVIKFLSNQIHVEGCETSTTGLQFNNIFIENGDLTSAVNKFMTDTFGDRYMGCEIKKASWRIRQMVVDLYFSKVDKDKDDIFTFDGVKYIAGEKLDDLLLAPFKSHMGTDNVSTIPHTWITLSKDTYGDTSITVNDIPGEIICSLLFNIESNKLTTFISGIYC